jgi:hypothetical protein
MLTIKQAMEMDISIELKTKLKDHPDNFILVLTDTDNLLVVDPNQNKHIIFDSDHAEASDEKAMLGAGQDLKCIAMQSMEMLDGGL